MAGGFNFQNAPPTGQQSWYNDPTFQQLYNQIVGNTGPGGFQWTAQNTTDKLNQYVNDFSQQFTNATGQAPTADQISQFLTQAVSPVGGTQAGFAGTDPNAVAQQYIPQAYQPQIQQQGQKQTAGLANQISNVATQVGNQTAQQLKDPLSLLYQGFSGGMNNMGITPGSGAFEAGLGGTIGNAASGAISSGLQSLGFPSIAGNQSPSLSALGGLGLQQQGLMSNYNQQLNDWFMQSGLGEKLFNESQPSAAQQDIGMASGAANAAGGLMKGAGELTAGASLTSYICMALISHGLATESDLDLLHYKTVGAIWKKARAFWWYATHAQDLVAIAEERKMDWKPWRKWFLDDPISKPTAVEAVDEFIVAYKSLCFHLGAIWLWDEKVERTSFLDSLQFLPLVLTYPPFVKAAWKVFKMKCRFIIDLPLSEVP